jgi:L-aspartate oxidase
VQTSDGALQVIWAKATVLAAGGLGRLYRETTNPPIATGDGYAMAFRAGAVLQDMEFVQFHPTTLYIAGASRSLISEAVRGEGGRLVDKNGRHFMKDFHPKGELAPRDVVSRAIVEQMEKTDATNVFLDLSGIPARRIAQRFPLIARTCREFDIDIRKDLVPVRPSAHYMVGGVRVDTAAATNLQRLFACGEVTSSGLHGANRLGSNSLLEGLVYGKCAGENAAQLAHATRGGTRAIAARIRQDVPASTKTLLDVADVRNSLRAVMWRNAGIRRNGPRLAETLEIIDFWAKYVMDKEFDSPDGWTLQNKLSVGRLVVLSALKRTETRGVHYRTDFPRTDEKHWRRRVRMQRRTRRHED